MPIKENLKEFGLDVARVALPKSTERVLGIAEEKPITQETIVDAQRNYEANPNALRQEIKDIVTRDVQAGVLDKDQIRSDVKAHVKREINNNLLRRVIPPDDPDIGGFLKNARRNTQEIVDGLGALLGIGIKSAMNPIDSAIAIKDFSSNMITSPAYRDEINQTFVKPIIEEYKEYRHPLTKIYEDPLDVFLDITAIFSLGATTAGKVGAKTTAQVLRKASTPVTLKGISTATKTVLRQVPGGKNMVENLELSAATRKLLRKEQAHFLVARNKAINEVDKRVNKLTDAEVRALPLAAEGFAQPPKNASRDFYEALGLVKSMAKDQQRFGLEIGALTPEIIERRRWQPLAKWLEKQEDFTPKFKGKFISTPYDQLSGAELNAYIGNIQRVFPEADPVYMRHFFDDKPTRFSNFFLSTQPVRTFKPGFLKKSYGKSGYIGESGNITKEQLKSVLERQTAENLKWQRNIQLIEGLKNHPEVLPLKKGENPLPGYEVFAPDGMLRFYRGTINLTDELKKKVAVKDDVWDAFEDAVNASFPAEKAFLGVTKAKLYQAPAPMANTLKGLVKSSNPYVKLFYDKPLDAFRFSVLSLYPRWNFNNIIGNTIFSIISGDVFNPKAFYLYSQARKADVFPDELFGGVHRVERTTSGRLGHAANLPLVKSTIQIHDEIMNTKVIGRLVRNAERAVKVGVFNPIVKLGNLGFRVNQVVDDAFKGVAFVNRALKEDRKGFIRRMTVNFDESLKALEKVKADPKLTERLVDDVHDWYYHGFNLTDFERRAVRRVIPFWSWMRWATLYSFRVATEAPVRANIIANMSRDFYTFTGQEKLPEWMRGAVPIGNDEDGTVYYLKTRGLNPFSHLNDFMNEGILGAGLQGAAPLIKTGVEQAQGRDVFLGQAFTRKDIHRSFGGTLYKFDPERGEVVRIDEKIKPSLVENLLRNYIPQYMLMETALTRGERRYTAEGLDTIFSDLFKDEKDREAVVQDIITRQGKEKTDFLREAGKALGINIQEVKPEQERQKQKAIQQATSAILNKELPILNPRFRELVKQRILKEIAEGTPREELEENVKQWIGVNVQELSKLNTSPQPLPQ